MASSFTLRQPVVLLADMTTSQTMRNKLATGSLEVADSQVNQLGCNIVLSKFPRNMLVDGN